MKSIISFRQIFYSLLLGFAAFGLLVFVESLLGFGIDISWRVPLILALSVFAASFFFPNNWR